MPQNDTSFATVIVPSRFDMGEISVPDSVVVSIHGTILGTESDMTTVALVGGKNELPDLLRAILKELEGPTS